MSESKSFLVTIMKWRISGQGYKHLARFSRFILSESAGSTIQKINPVGCFVTKGLFIHIYFLLFEKHHQNRTSRAGEKISPTISLFFRKTIA